MGTIFKTLFIYFRHKNSQKYTYLSNILRSVKSAHFHCDDFVQNRLHHLKKIMVVFLIILSLLNENRKKKILR